MQATLEGTGKTSKKLSNGLGEYYTPTSRSSEASLEVKVLLIYLKINPNLGS